MQHRQAEWWEDRWSPLWGEQCLQGGGCERGHPREVHCCETVLCFTTDKRTINEVIKESYELDSIDEKELFDEYMTLSDELAMELEEYMPEDIIINARAYKWDNSDNTIKLVLAMAHLELGELKLSDITRRLLTQVD